MLSSSRPVNFYMTRGSTALRVMRGEQWQRHCTEERIAAQRPDRRIPGNMKADTLKLAAVFTKPVSYQVPLFQRPYVWGEENWTALWDDIQTLLDKRVRGEKTYAHFLGVAFMEQLPNSTGPVECRQVIDGQQRFTTLQLFLCAARILPRAWTTRD